MFVGARQGTLQACRLSEISAVLQKAFHSVQVVLEVR